MGKRSTSTDQLGLFDTPAGPIVHQAPMSYRESLVDQVVRDMQTLTLEDVWIHPNREFYEQRIAMYKETIATL